MDEMTAEEQNQYWLNRWVKTLPGEGTPESVKKNFPVEPEPLLTTVRTLEMALDYLAREMATNGFRDELPCMDANYLLHLLQTSTLPEQGKI